jgi:hypothetical protein
MRNLGSFNPRLVPANQVLLASNDARPWCPTTVRHRLSKPVSVLAIHILCGAESKDVIAEQVYTKCDFEFA